MLTAHQISKSYGINKILDQVTFSVNSGERVGLIGPNGAGKSTLLRILIGQERPDEGSVSYTPKSIRIGYLAQGFRHPELTTVASYLGQAAGDPAHLQESIKSSAERLASDPDNQQLQNDYDSLLDRISRYDPQVYAEILLALGLDDINKEIQLGELSGGQKTRLSLAIALQNDPQMLLLDEPTNHLDIGILEWLEDYLLRYSGAVLLVSHDRTFLDRCVSKILDIDPDTHKIHGYSGNYSKYLEQYIANKEGERQAYKEQVYEIKRMRADIARTKQQAKWVEMTTTPGAPGVRRIAKKVAAKAKAREKKLERYLVSEDRLEKPKQGWHLKLEFNAVKRLGKRVLSMHDLSVGYAIERPLINIPSLTVQSGQRIVITGKNGSGKTTLLRTIIGDIEKLGGYIRKGPSVRLGYMQQEQRTMNSKQSALEAVQEVSPLSETEARSYLHYFLFSDEDPLRSLEKLSYGERARLELALLVASGANLLLLDEPINHLDIPSRELFEQALASFPGTVLAVVHDRYFIERFATDLWIIEGGNLETRIVTGL